MGKTKIDILFSLFLSAIICSFAIMLSGEESRSNQNIPLKYERKKGRIIKIVDSNKKHENKYSKKHKDEYPLITKSIVKLKPSPNGYVYKFYSTFTKDEIVNKIIDNDYEKISIRVKRNNVFKTYTRTIKSYKIDTIISKRIEWKY